MSILLRLVQVPLRVYMILHNVLHNISGIPIRRLKVESVHPQSAQPISIMDSTLQPPDPRLYVMLLLMTA